MRRERAGAGEPTGAGTEAVFEGDSYLILIGGGEVALAALSGLLVFLAVASVRVVRRYVNLPAAVPALGIVSFWVFVWVTPQIYYLLYMALLEELEFRWIVGWPPGPQRLMSLLAFQAEATKVDVALGVLGWVMVLAAFPRA